MRRLSDAERLTPETVLRAYSIGIFPMASHRGDPTVHWVAPAMRGVLPLGSFHIARRLRRILRSERFTVRCNTAFAEVIAACAAPREGHPETWINTEINRVFCELHRLGHAHSVETWLDGRLVGGLYGLALGGAFFGESMFSHATDASKVALVHLVARLQLGRFTLLDIQFITDHLKQFGAVEIPAPTYLQVLDEALRRRACFYGDPPPEALDSVFSALFSQSSTQIS
ncbi:MAG: leucyl/phenylalanyl-tRNA--protein transferase [Rhodospirillales bacterium]|nr:leucyl/phenylalanyl-tRNA--protein transferase [Rhodospirillales bacterium]